MYVSCGRPTLKWSDYQQPSDGRALPASVGGGQLVSVLKSLLSGLDMMDAGWCDNVMYVYDRRPSLLPLRSVGASRLGGLCDSSAISGDQW